MIRRTPQHHSVAFSSPVRQTQRIYNRFSFAASDTLIVSSTGFLQNRFLFLSISSTIGWSNRLDARHRQFIVPQTIHFH
jgi:hypothetical protein